MVLYKHGGGDYMRNKMVRGISIVLILVGLGAISYGIYYKRETAIAQESLFKDFNNVLKKIENGEIKEPEDVEVSEVKVDAIALLEIPKIGLKVAVAEGTSDDIISHAVGHFVETAQPGQVGNCALVGHRNFTTGEFFLKINKLELGDEVKVTTYDNTYVYKVTGQQIVNPDDVQVLNPTPTPTITLVTCTWDGDKRLIVKGELVK